MKKNLTVKKLAYLLLATLLVLTIGCSESAETLRYTSWQSSPVEQSIIRQNLESFKKDNPDVAFKYEPIPGNYPEKIQLMLGTHTAPDLFWLKSFTAPSFYHFDILKPLDDYVQRDTTFDINDFFPVFRDSYKDRGHFYGFPKDFNVYVLFYNKKMFAQAGISAAPKNWAELENAARKLTKDTNGDGKTDQYGLVIEPAIEMLMAFVYQNGGEFHDAQGNLKINDPAFTQALTFYHGLYEKKIATIPSDMGAGWNGDVIGRKNAAMAISGGWMIPYLKEAYPDIEWGVVPLPAGKKQATLAFSTGFVIPKEAKYPDQAWTMLAYLAGKKGMAEWTKSGLALPTRKSVAEANGFYKDPVYKVFMESVPFAVNFKINYMQRWYDESNAALQAIFYKGKDPILTMKELEPRVAKYRLK